MVGFAHGVRDFHLQNDKGLLFTLISDMNVASRVDSYLTNMKMPWEKVILCSYLCSFFIYKGTTASGHISGSHRVSHQEGQKGIYIRPCLDQILLRASHLHQLGPSFKFTGHRVPIRNIKINKY